MRSRTLLLLRLSLGLFLLVWGADKLLDVRHGVLVSDNFYGGLFSAPALLTAFGVAEVVLGLLIAAGAWRRFTYPALLAVTGATLLAVWRSVVDPLGLVLDGTQLLFFPSLVIFAASLVLWAFKEEDTLAWDGRRENGTAATSGRGYPRGVRP